MGQYRNRAIERASGSYEAIKQNLYRGFIRHFACLVFSIKYENISLALLRLTYELLTAYSYLVGRLACIIRHMRV